MTLVTGASIAAIFLTVGIYLGRKFTDPGGTQARKTVREMLGIRKAQQRQLATARDRVERMIADPRTAPHDRFFLEEHVRPVLKERQLNE